jgi:hypothetical protein
VQPWPGWVRYTLLAVLFAVVGIGLVTVLYDKGFLPIAGPLVVICLLPLLRPLRSYGLRSRSRRLGDRLDQQLAALGPALEQERSLAAPDRPSGARDEALASAAGGVESARRQLASGQSSAAADTLDALSRTVTSAWHRDAPVARQAAEAARTARKLRSVRDQVDRAGRR